MMESNEEELKNEMNAIGCHDQLESGELENWKEAIAICGKRMY
jgi:hypothetical protein